MIALYSIDQHYSQIEREKAFKTLHSLLECNAIKLTTCNRVEIYDGSGFVPEHVVSHLFKVSAGLKSSFVGESAILGQVKDAYLKASEHGCIDKNMHRLFQTAIFVGKRVRTETSISKGAVSHSQAAVALINRNFSDLSNKTIAFIGSNKVNETILKYLKKQGVHTFFLANRTFEKACQLAQETGGQAFRIDRLKEVLAKSDILVSATSAPHHIVRMEHIDAYKPLFIIDLAVPCDVDPEIGMLQNVRLFTLEDLERTVEQNLDKRFLEIEKAKVIVDEEVKKFISWQLKQPEVGN